MSTRRKVVSLTLSSNPDVSIYDMDDLSIMVTLLMSQFFTCK